MDRALGAKQFAGVGAGGVVVAMGCPMPQALPGLKNERVFEEGINGIIPVPAQVDPADVLAVFRQEAPYSIP